MTINGYYIMVNQLLLVVNDGHEQAQGLISWLMVNQRLRDVNGI